MIEESRSCQQIEFTVLVRTYVYDGVKRTDVQIEIHCQTETA